MNPVEQGLSLYVRTLRFALPSRREQQLHLGPLVLQPLELATEDGLHLLLGVERCPLVANILTEEAELTRRKLQHIKAAFHRGPNRRNAGGHEALHQDHQKPDGCVLFASGLVVALPDVFSDSVVQDPLVLVLCCPCNWDELSASRLEERVPVGVDGVALLRADHVGTDVLLFDRVVVGERFLVQEAQESSEGVSLSLVGRRRQEEQVRCGLGQPFTKAIPGDLLGASTQSVTLINDDEIPTSRDQILETLSVVAADSFGGPSPPTVHRLH